jgi:hypothetical protein
VRAALVAGHRVDLVDDHRRYTGEETPRFLGGQQDKERLRRRDEHVRRLA